MATTEPWFLESVVAATTMVHLSSAPQPFRCGCGAHKTFYGALIMEVARLVMSGDGELILQPFVGMDLGAFGFMQ